MDKNNYGRYAAIAWLVCCFFLAVLVVMRYFYG